MIPRYRPVAHGGMAEAEDGRYVHVEDLARALDMEPEQLDRLSVRGAGATGPDDLSTTEEGEK